jgi:ubiquitin C-terminal hydrolase
VNRCLTYGYQRLKTGWRSLVGAADPAHPSRFRNREKKYEDMSRKGLENRAGQHNCFLNAVIQSLWHLEDFRSTVLKQSFHSYDDRHCVFCALKVRSTELEFFLFPHHLQVFL